MRGEISTMKRDTASIELASKYSSKSDGLIQSLSDWLRYDFNPDCLLEVFQFLNYEDLISICRLDDDDQFFTSLINGYVISKVLIPIEISGTNLGWQEGFSSKKALESFGKSLKRVKIIMDSSNFNDVIQKIITYCSPDRINEIHLEVKRNGGNYAEKSDLDWNLMHLAIPYLRGIKHLNINSDNCINHTLIDFCAFLINEAENLETLKLSNFHNANLFDQITFERSKLKELRLVEVTSNNREVFVNFIKKLPLLEVFEYNNSSSLSVIFGETLAQYCPNLRVYTDMTNGHYNDSNYYDFLQHFNHLKNVTVSLKPWEDDEIQIQDISGIFFDKKSLSKLTIYMMKKCQVVFTGIAQDIAPKGYPKFTDAEFHFEEGVNIEKWAILLQSWQPLMDEICKINLTSRLSLQNISEIFKHTPRIQEVSISTSRLYQLPAEVRKIRRVIGTIVKEHKNVRQSEKVHFVVNSQQAKEFKVLKNIDELITLSEKKVGINYILGKLD